MSGYNPQRYLPDGLQRWFERTDRRLDGLERYRAPVVDIPEVEVEAGSITVLQPGGGTAVSLGTQASPDTSGWSGNPTDWTDPLAHWIWHTALSSGGRPAGEEAWVVAEYESLITRTVDIEVAADNSATLFLNGVELGPVPDYLTRTTFTATLVPGTNIIAAECANTSSGGPNPAGFLFSMRDDGSVLLRSEDGGAWYAYTAEPADWPTPGHPGMTLDDLVDVNAPAPADGDALVWDSSTSRWVADTVSGGVGGGATTAVHVQHQLASGTSATLTAGSWLARPLNTVVSNTVTGASLASNQVTLPAGTYDVDVFATFYSTAFFQSRLYDATNAAVLLLGSTGYARATDAHSIVGVISGRFTLGGTTAVELQYRVGTGGAQTGGLAAGFGTEVFANLFARKVA